ncbi:MAG: DUF5693 family protein [Clostridiales Family XIII bacterium]|jgi:hypothetical protein|nr:DUF5693 family protein [Clostridiales Family XIII bacterium]
MTPGIVKRSKRGIAATALAIALAVLIGVSVASGFYALAGRFGAESRNKTYDIVLDYEETAALAKQSPHDVSWWLGQFKDMKINKAGLAEESLKSLTESDYPVTASVMGVLMKELNWRERLAEDWARAIERHGFDSYDVMVSMGSAEAYDFVARALTERYGADRVLLRPYAEGAGYALIDSDPRMTLYTPKYKEQDSKGGGFIELIDITDSKIMYLSLGLLPEKVKTIQASGMEVIPRTASYDYWNSERYARAVIAGYERFGIKPSYFIVAGESVPGFDDGLGFIEGYLRENGVKTGIIEDTTQLQNIEQHGILELAKDSGYNTVRVFSVWNYIQNRYQYYGYKGAEEIENTLFRAVVERNVRVIYYKPIRELKDLHTYITDVDDYKGMFANLEARLAKHGISLGEASPMEDYRVPFLLKLLMAWGCVAAALLLLQFFFPLAPSARLVLLALGLAASSASFYVMPNSAELVVSLVNALAYACLSVVFITSVAKKRFDMAPYAPGAPGFGLPAAVGAGAVALLGATAIALLGGLMTAAPLSSASYMLEIDIFRGVKAAQLLPILFFVVAYLAYFGFGKNKRKVGRLEFNDIRDLMNTPIKIWMLLMGAVVGAVGMYYIMRTGHEVITASRVEMLFRNDLENLLPARPRTKEFLFAFPAVMLTMYAARRRLRFWTVIFGISGVVGLTSVVNTFMHLRTPLYLGLIRTGFSVAFGIVAGLVALALFDLLYKGYLRMKKAGFFPKASK